MLKTFIELLAGDAPIFRRYAWMAAAYGLLSGLTITAVIPILGHLLAGDTRNATLWLPLLLIGVLACWACRRKVEAAGMNVGIAVLQNARHRIGDHVARLPVGWFTPEHTARLSHVVSNGLQEVAQLPAHLFTPVISGAVTPLVVVATLTLLNWQMGLIALIAAPIMVGVFNLASRLGRKADEGFHLHAAQTSQRMIEFAQAQSVLRAFNGEGGGTRFLEEAIDQQRDANAGLIRISAASVVLNAWVVQVVFAALLIAGVLWIDKAMRTRMATGDVIAVVVALLLVNRFVDPLLDIAGYGEALRGARGQLDAVRDIFAIQPLAEPSAPQAPRDSSVELKNVSFRYANEQPNILTQVNLHIEPGNMVALVGASGSGKTTLTRLISRFFDVNQGRVLVGGIDVREMSSEQLTGQISQIFQNTYLFQGSIADNIRIGKHDATDQEVLDAARQAGVAEIIERLPQGLDTPVGEGGARLSGGERQRISIARALIKSAPILLIDEATAALDAENQVSITEALMRLRGKCTLIVIAHQLSTIAMADRIVVLDDGMLVEQGTHDELHNKQGLYAHFLNQRQAAKGWRLA